MPRRLGVQRSQAAAEGLRKQGILGRGVLSAPKEGSIRQTKPRQEGRGDGFLVEGYWVALTPPSSRGICRRVGDCSMMRTSSRSM